MTYSKEIRRDIKGLLFCAQRMLDVIVFYFTWVVIWAVIATQILKTKNKDKEEYVNKKFIIRIFVKQSYFINKSSKI